jgi:hypothetical protein
MVGDERRLSQKWHYSGIAGSSFLTDPDKVRTTKQWHLLSCSKKRAMVGLLCHWSSVKKSHLCNGSSE